MAVEQMYLSGIGANLPVRRGENRLTARPIKARRRVSVMRKLAKPMPIAVAASMVFILVFSVYVAAYASVTARSLDLAKMRQEYAALHTEGESLRAELSRLKLPGAIVDRAQKIGLERANAASADTFQMVAARRVRVSAPTEQRAHIAVINLDER